MLDQTIAEFHCRFPVLRELEIAFSLLASNIRFLCRTPEVTRRLFKQRHIRAIRARQLQAALAQFRMNIREILVQFKGRLVSLECVSKPGQLAVQRRPAGRGTARASDVL